MKAKVIVKKETEFEIEFQVPCYTKSNVFFYKVFGTNKRDAVRIVLPSEYWGATIEETNIEMALVGNEIITPEEFYQSYSKVITYLRDKLDIEPK